MIQVGSSRVTIYGHSTTSAADSGLCPRGEACFVALSDSMPGANDGPDADRSSRCIISSPRPLGRMRLSWRRCAARASSKFPWQTPEPDQQSPKELTIN